MKQFPFGDKKVKCVVLCAGKGLRIFPNSEYIPKVMIEINKKPVLEYVIEYWKRYADGFIFVVGYKKEQVIEYVSNVSIKAEFVEQETLRGIADAISHVKDCVSDNFIVVLGDCICDGEFRFPEKIVQGVGVRKTENIEEIKRNYSIELKNNIVYQVVEKPKEIPNDLCGMGVYFFDRRVFRYIDKTKPSKLRNEVEITDVIQNMIEAGEKIIPVFFEGDYVNVTFPYDVIKTEEGILIKEKQIVQYAKAWKNILWPIEKKFLLKRAQIVGDQVLPFINEGDSMLGFGCGSDIHLLAVSRYLASRKKIHLTCVDVIKRKIEDADFIKYEGGRLPFKDNQFDVVVASIALHHTDNPDFYLQEIIRVSKDRIIICEDTYKNKFEEFLAKFVCISSDFLVGDINMKRSFKSVEEWKGAFEKHNVKLLTFKRFYPHPYPWIPTRNVIIELRK